MCLTLLKGQTVEKPLELAAANSQCLALSSTRPFKSAFLQPSVVEPESVAVPAQNFESVTISVTEHKHAI